MREPTPAEMRRVAVAAIVALALLSSASSLGNGFAYDDRPIIQSNPTVHSLHRWWHLFEESYWPASGTGALYRPVTMLLYAVQWAVGGGSPLIFHILNVALYVGLCVVMLWLARLVLPDLAAWVAAALFSVHPVHVEAVGNVVGQGELWTALLLCGATAAYIRWRRAGEIDAPRSALLVATLGVALLVKENAVALPALLLVAEFTVIGDSLHWRTRLTRIRPLLLWMTLTFLGYLVARLRVLPEGMATDVVHPVWVELDASHRLATILGVVLPEWIRLLVWPAKLLADYSPRDIPVLHAWSPTVLPGAGVVLGMLGLAVLTWRRAPAAAFGIAFFLVAMGPVSNVIIPTGVMLAERTLLLPSVGFVIAVATLVPPLLEKAARVGRGHQVARGGAVALALLLAAGAVRSAERQRTWASNADVLIELMVDAPANYRSHWGWGSVLMERRLFGSGEREWRKAIELFPAHPGPAAELAEAYRKNGFCEAAVPLYQHVVKVAPGRDDMRSNLVICLIKVGRFEEARIEAIEGIDNGGSTNVFRVLLARAYSRMAQAKAVTAVTVKPQAR